MGDRRHLVRTRATDDRRVPCVPDSRRAPRAVRLSRAHARTIKTKILGANAARVYGIDPDALRAHVARDELTWVAEAVPRIPAVRRPDVRMTDMREHYRTHGWVAVPGLVDDAWLDRFRAVTAEFVEQSRALTESNVLFDLDAGHSAAEPRLRRLELADRPARHVLGVRVAVADRRRRRRPARPEREVPPLEAELQGARTAARR